ncbi:hypothetical protein LK12_15155 [Novosphingobium malaysiense]|uniref:Uncharacterized protein n=1 Tax=Novosphingobium malaysiense TaxID=1348853 RepID=A0A0B1ZJI5_9SPHN|nr:hypothetical protein LK12_15155 [Novosphingobium malaysiense]
MPDFTRLGRGLNVSVNLGELLSINEAHAIMPDGKMLDREEVLDKLGLDPTTPPDAWLTIIACGSNASAIKTEKLRELVDNGTLNARRLDSLSRERLG